jgi:hypothetical protein
MRSVTYIHKPARRSSWVEWKRLSYGCVLKRLLSFTTPKVARPPAIHVVYYAADSLLAAMVQLSDPAVVDALYEIASMRLFAGLHWIMPSPITPPF